MVAVFCSWADWCCSGRDKMSLLRLWDDVWKGKEREGILRSFLSINARVTQGAARIWTPLQGIKIRHCEKQYITYRSGGLAVREGEEAPYMHENARLGRRQA